MQTVRKSEAPVVHLPICPCLLDEGRSELLLVTRGRPNHTAKLDMYQAYLEEWYRGMVEDRA